MTAAGGHYHLYASPPGSRAVYVHQRRAETRQAAATWARRHLEPGRAAMTRQCDGGPGCPADAPVEIEVLQAGPQVYRDPRRRLDRGTRALIRRRAAAAGYRDVNAYIRAVLAGPERGGG